MTGILDADIVPHFIVDRSFRRSRRNKSVMVRRADFRRMNFVVSRQFMTIGIATVAAWLTLVVLRPPAQSQDAYALARYLMVERDIVREGIKNPAVIAAVRTVPPGTCSSPNSIVRAPISTRRCRSVTSRRFRRRLSWPT